MIRSRNLPSVCLLGLLVCGVSFASIRMAGLGPNLVDIVADPMTDPLSYPQSNTLEENWLVGVEVLQGDRYNLLARTPGRLSITGAMHASLKDANCDPSLAIGWNAGPVALGVSATAWAIGEQHPYGDDVSGDTSVHLLGYDYGLGEGTIGCRWSSPGLVLDGNAGLLLARGYWMRGTLDSFVLCGDSRSTVVSPVLRLTLPRDMVTWRVLASYTHTMLREDFYDTLNGLLFQRRETRHQLGLTGGLVFTPRPNFVVTAGLRCHVLPAAHNWSWNLLSPAGFEWNSGPLTLRIGAEASVGFWTSELRHGAVTTYFHNTTYFGLGVRPLPRLSFDFTPCMEDIANLRGWELGATATF